MLDKKDTTLLKLDCKNKDKVYDMLFGKADACLKNAKTVALLYLGSPYYMTRVLEEYNIEEVNIFTAKDFKFIYEPFEDAERVKIWYVDDMKDTFKDCDMKFDCIIMNPPYERNLHLKILAEAVKHLKDEKSTCVNLSPVRWLQDPLAKYKKKSDYNKYEKTIRQNIADINVINKIEAQTYFSNTVMDADLAIYVCNKLGGFDCSTLINPIILKILNKQSSKIVFDNDCKDGIRVRFPIICNNGGSGTGRKIGMASFGKMLWFKDGMKDGKPWHDWYMHNQYTKTTDTIPYSVKFNSENEAINFCKQFDTSFCKVYTHWMKSDVHVTPDIVLWMGDAINPRTGKKGYEGEWTNEDFYSFFNITPEEQKVIEKTMKKYK